MCGHDRWLLRTLRHRKNAYNPYRENGSVHILINPDLEPSNYDELDSWMARSALELVQNCDPVVEVMFYLPRSTTRIYYRLGRDEKVKHPECVPHPGRVKHPISLQLSQDYCG